MRIRSTPRRSRPAALIASVAVLALAGLCTLTQAAETTAGFTASVTNPTNTGGTAPYFACEAAYGADFSDALFAYKLSDVGTSTTTPGSALYEAEAAQLSGARVESRHPNYSGTGYVLLVGSAVFTVAAPLADTYTIALRYGIQDVTSDNKRVSVQVDSGPTQELILPSLPSNAHWSTVYLSATLAPGSHSITVTKVGSIATVDYLHLTPQAAGLVRDTFSGTRGATLTSRNADAGGAWTRRYLSGADDDVALTAAGRVRKLGASTYGAMYTSSAIPNSADYVVSADIVTLTNTTGDQAGVVGRLDPSNAAGTFYLARYEQAMGAYVLFRVINNSWTLLGLWAAPSTSASHTHRLSLEMKGTTIRLLVDGAQRVSVTDGGITAPGLAGISLGLAATQIKTTITDTTGMHLDNFETAYLSVSEPVRASDFSPRKSHGNYQGTRSTGPQPTSSGCPRDGGSAYVLDGRTSYVSNPTPWTGTNTFTVELWFQTTVAGGRLIGFGNAATGTSTVYDRMIYMTDAGRLVFGVYNGTARTVMSEESRNFADGQWHHVAATLSPAGMHLYVDGSRAASAHDPSTTTARASTGYWRIGFDTISGPWPAPPSNPYFTGGMRFAAVYTVALSADQIARHSASGR